MPFKFEKLEVWQLAPDTTSLQQAYSRAETLAAKLHSMRKAISPGQAWVREESAPYVFDEGITTSDD